MTQSSGQPASEQPVPPQAEEKKTIDPAMDEAIADVLASTGARQAGDAADARVVAEKDAKIADLEKKLAEATDRALRAIAEAENTRKRLEKERLDTGKFAVSGFARDMLGVADNLRRALAAIKPEQLETSPELKSIATGVEATERELIRLFEKNGIKKIDPLDERFDPNLHEVIFESPVPGKEPGIVIQVFESGYTIHERLLRPARVGVSKAADGEGMAAGGTLDQQV